MARKAKIVTGKMVISESEAKRKACGIAAQVTKDVLEPRGFSVSSLSRKEKKLFKTGFADLVLSQVIKKKYSVKPGKDASARKK